MHSTFVLRVAGKETDLVVMPLQIPHPALLNILEHLSIFPPEIEPNFETKVCARKYKLVLHPSYITKDLNLISLMHWLTAY